MKNIKLSFICLFVFILTNLISPEHALNLEYKRLPFVLGSIALATHILSSLVRRRLFVQLDLSLFFIFIVFLFAVHLTFFRSVDHDSSLQVIESYFLKSLILFILVSNVIQTKNEFKAYFLLLSVGAFYIAYRLTNFPMYNQGRPWVVGSNLASDPNDVSMVLGYSLPIIVSLLITIRSKVVKVVLLYFIFTVLLGLVEAESRGAFVGLAVAFLLFVIEIKKSKRFIYVIALIPLIIAFAVRYVPPDYIYRMQEISNPEADSTGSASIRIQIMKISLNYILKHPVSNYGPGNNGYMIADKTGFNEPEDTVFHGNHVHSCILQIGADLGLIPMAFYIAFIISLLLKLRESEKRFLYRKETEHHFLVYTKALRISLVVLLISAFFLPVAYKFYFFYVGGACVAIERISRTMSSKAGNGRNAQ